MRLEMNVKDGSSFSIILMAVVFFVYTENPDFIVKATQTVTLEPQGWVGVSIVRR
jgi:hypothetical protein